MATLKRSIHTDLYTPKAQEILYRMKLYLRNHWGSSQMVRNATLANVEVAPNGEILWNVYDSAPDTNRTWSSVYYGSSTYACRPEDKKVREWMSMVLKTICFRQFKMHDYGTPEPTAKEIHKMWSRKNDTVVKLMTDECSDPFVPKVCDSNGYQMTAKYVNKLGPITVAEIYCVYEKLLNRKRFEKAYSKKVKELIVGTEKDAIATELEVARREEIVRINKKLEEDKKALSIRKEKALAKAREDVLAAYKKMEDELVKEHAKAMKKLEDKLNFLEDGDELGAALFG